MTVRRVALIVLIVALARLAVPWALHRDNAVLERRNSPQPGYVTGP